MRGCAIVLSVLCMLWAAHGAKADDKAGDVKAEHVKAEQRVAFVVGNGAYANMPRLANAPGSAKAVATMLEKIGFEVVQGIDVTRQQMTERLLEFGKKADGADVALFYYAGQGIDVRGVSYLLPVDADLKSEMDLKLGNGINLDTALDQTMSSASVRLIFLDISRNDPFAAKGHSPGKPVSAGAIAENLVLDKDADETRVPHGTMINYATGPGQIASDGKKGGHRPFTQALLDKIAAPGVEIQAAMTEVRAEVSEETNSSQMPWGHSRLVGEIYLNPATAAK
jgi:uncharacterized caspase-like protein